MAIAPNTTFFTGYTLTATQLNAFPRGVMAFNTATASDTTIFGEEVQITGSSFTAVANRYYKITYFEPSIFNSSGATATARIRLTNLAGAVQQTALSFAYVTWEDMSCVAVTTLTAGPTNFVATLTSSDGTSQASRTSTQYAFLLVEDIGPA
jgi:hypothetical protein